ncbi:MAG: IS110 family transposase [Candidatus Promineifilaceae bacterium]|nr:IS110 family transposase [Candidatus Promineifilaceae bacterium]
MQVYIGIDWSEQKHDTAFQNEHGTCLAQLSFAHTPQGFGQFEELRRAFEVQPSACYVGLETAHNLLIDYLWAQGYSQVYVVPPSVVKSSRGRYRWSGARTDESDARLLADLLRTDRQSLQPWFPDSLLTRQLRAKVSLYFHLVRTGLRLRNRLRAVLLRYYPAALEVFYHLDAQISLAFIQAYPAPQDAAELSFEQFRTFARRYRYSRPRQLPARFAMLQGSYPTASPGTVAVYREEAVLLAGLLEQTVQSQKTAQKQLRTFFADHPDREIFASLPGVGEILGSGLLAKFGDDRRRFPSPASVQALAGTCPVTRQSGKKKTVHFRKSCDRQFRHIAQQWAINSLRQSVWASAYYRQVRPRCRSENHAYRCLANRWLAIAWKLWQNGETYDEEYHLRQRAKRSRLI